MLPPQRHLFDIPQSVCYLNCAYMSPLLRSAREAGERAVARKSSPWRISPADFFEEAESARGLFARLVGGDPDGVAIIPSASYGIGIAAANVRVDAAQSILILEEQFPSNVYPWMALAKERNAELVTVPRPDDHDWTAAVLERMDVHTAVVAVPNCHWTDGTLIDLERTATRARELGAAVVVDATQSLGVHPFDVSAVRPDFLVTATYKWMLGPYSLGFMYVGDRWRAGKPLEHNWIARAGSEHFGGLVEYRNEFQPGARRYDVGERSNFALLPVALAAMRQILDWGVGNIAATVAGLTHAIEERAAAAGLASVAPGRRADHLVGLQLGPGMPRDLAERLAARNVFVSVRGNRLRVAPHLYNNEADIERLFDALSATTHQR